MFRWAWNLWLQIKFWKAKMKRSSTKDAIYGGLLELIKSDRHYKLSSIGREYIEDMAWRMHESEQEELNALAKQMVFDQLKKRHE
jgi:hypothetical protein